MADWAPDTGGSNWNDGEDSGFAADNTGFTTAFTGTNIVEVGGEFGGGGRGGDDTCRKCGETGHFARECPSAPQNSGECYNCGQTGHNKAECPNEKVERPFTGTCRLCNKEGHVARECPDKPADICRICKKEGHKAIECTSKRADVFGEGEKMDAAAAWDALQTADSEKDMDDVKTAFLAYCHANFLANNLIDLADLEQGFRTESRNLHLIAKERELIDSLTIVSLNGDIDQKHVLIFSWTAKAKRGKQAEGWPATPEENLEKLKSCGIPMDRGIPKCDKCNELGHIKKHCKSEVEDDIVRVEVKCIICSEIGHRARDCTQERIDPFACRNCKKSGHNSKECPEPRSAEGVECNKCNQMGHFSRDCPNVEPRQPMTCRNCGEEGHRAAECEKERVITCRNCNQEGHISKECTEPKNPANTKCRNCDEIGHFSKNCPKPRDYTKIQCKNCGEMGHTITRCKKPLEAIGGEAGFGDSGGAPLTGEGASGGWNNDDAPTASTGGADWGSGDVPASEGW